MRAMKNKETREFVDLAEKKFSVKLSRKRKYELDYNIVLIDDEPMFFYSEKELYPTLKNLLKNNFLKKITVDMGAVKFVAKGADIMRPGITGIEDGIEEGDAVVIVDETHDRPLGVGKAKFSSSEMESMDKGSAIESIHYVGDNVWNYKN